MQAPPLRLRLLHASGRSVLPECLSVRLNHPTARKARQKGKLNSSRFEPAGNEPKICSAPYPESEQIFAGNTDAELGPKAFVKGDEIPLELGSALLIEAFGQ